FDLLTQGSQRVLEPLLLGKVIRRQELSGTRLLVLAPTKLFGDLLVGVALPSKSHGLGVFKIVLAEFDNGLTVSELVRILANKSLGDFLLVVAYLPLGLSLAHEVAKSVVRIFTGPPTVTTREREGAVVYEVVVLIVVDD